MKKRLCFALASATLLATPAAALAADDIAIAATMLALVNEARAQGRRCGGTQYPPAPPVRWSEPLARAARSHSEDMAATGRMTHLSRDGTPPEVRVERAGYDYGATAENIAQGQPTAEGAMAQWLASPGHCANLMNADYTEMAVAMANNRRGAMGVYWTMVLATPIRSRSRPANR
jgi:uncharacterized protein YkwD